MIKEEKPGTCSQFVGQSVLFKLPALAIVAVSISLFFLFGDLFAKPVNSSQAEKVVKGWLKSDAKPFGMDFGGKIKKTEIFKDADGQPIYYIVHFEPMGFVIVSADDLVEPIVGFVRGDKYDPSPVNPLGALVSRDLHGRVAASHRLEAKFASNVKKNNLTSDEVILQEESSKAKGKWDGFQASADSAAPSIPYGFSDIRVPPLLLSQWNQQEVCGNYCYDYYTPNNDYAGCVATAAAQLMRYYQWPTTGIGTHAYQIQVNDANQAANTRGGDGIGGPYDWGQMEFVPDCGITIAQRQAIGALCYDAGVASKMQYAFNGSAAWLHNTKTALTDLFKYSNAVLGGDENNNIGLGLNGMINPNLDAGRPVILGIYGSEGHAVVADGYGYSSSTLYHHINMGWGGYGDAWYNLPSIYVVSGTSYNVVNACIYNVFIEGAGEIISGKVTDNLSNPVNGATVTNGVISTTTNNNGIYALTHVSSLVSNFITVTKTGYSFTPILVTTGRSVDVNTTSGNVWGADLQGDFTFPTDCDTATIGSESSTWDYPMHTSNTQSRTQVIYLANEIGSSGNINALALNISSAPNRMDKWTIRMKHTSMSSYSTASFDADDWTTVYEANEWIGATGRKTFWFAVPFEYDGTSNLLIDFSHNSQLPSSSGSCYYSATEDIRSAFAYSDGVDGDPLNWSETNSPSVSSYSGVPNIKLTLCNTPCKFGTYDVLRDAPRTFEDTSGTPVTFSITGGAWGEIVDCSENFNRIVLHDTNETSVFTITTPARQGTSVGDIIVEGSLKSISAKTTDLRGSIAISGSVGLIEVNDVNSSGTISIGRSSNPRAGVLMKLNRVSDLSIDSNMSIKTLMCTEWLDNDANSNYIRVPSLGTLQVRGNSRRGIAGDFEADLFLDGNSINSSTLASATIAGSINGHTWDITGNVRTIYVKGDVNDWDLTTSRGNISSLKVGRVSESSELLGLHIEGKVNSLRAAAWEGGVIEANAVNTLNVSGNRKAGVSGDFDADITLLGSDSIADVRKNTLGNAKIAGKIAGGIWDVTGNVGTIQFGSSEGSGWVGDFSGNVRTLKVTGYTDVNGIKVAGVFCADWSSNSLSSMAVTGNITDATITLNQAIDPKVFALGSMTVKSWIDGSRITSVGNIRSITTGGIKNSSCFAGDIAGLTDDNLDGVLDLPDPIDASSLGNALIGTFTVKGMKSPTDRCVTIDSVINSNVAARNFNTVFLTYPQYDNAGQYFGVAADYIKKLTIKDANGTVPYPNLTGPNDITPRAGYALIRVR